MLKTLRISNIVLVDRAEISFSTGFNVLTGETGSGKSAILQALNMIKGARSDTGLIRHEEERATVEATFDIAHITALNTQLDALGVHHEKGEELIIRRELHRSGKNRAFINNQQVQLGVLKMLGEQLFDLVGQHASRRLMEEGADRTILDLFAGTEELKRELKKKWASLVALKKELQNLSENEAQRLREIEICRMEIEELQRAAVKPGEDEELFAEYARLLHSEERAKNAFEILHGLGESEDALLPKLRQLNSLFGAITKVDSKLEEVSKTYQSCLLELQEVAHSIERYHSQIECDPEKLQEIDARLRLLHQLKRKYGPSLNEVFAYLEKKEERLAQLESADLSGEKIENELQILSLQIEALAGALTKERTRAAADLEIAMQGQLRALNMPQATFEVLIQPENRTQNGNESISFFLRPNVGEKKVRIQECASGGELSRIFLALQTLLAGKEEIPTLIFDEIDANIGGETATVIGQKLETLGNTHQILCITHFPQVAKCARHHIQISKQEKSGRTYTEARILNNSERKKELLRMSGSVAQPRTMCSD